ncbi:MAG: hypothetical protein EXS36_05685 [Pedosphaera sp.]|nr:hypothetical protein [Pedosphaera sp.]
MIKIIGVVVEAVKRGEDLRRAADTGQLQHSHGEHDLFWEYFHNRFGLASDQGAAPKQNAGNLLK